MDTVTEKFKNLLKKCMEKKISLDTIQQIICLRVLENPEQIAEELEQQIDKMDEQQIKNKISEILIKKQNKRDIHWV